MIRVNKPLNEVRVIPLRERCKSDLTHGPQLIHNDDIVNKTSVRKVSWDWSYVWVSLEDIVPDRFLYRYHKSLLVAVACFALLWLILSGIVGNTTGGTVSFLLLLPSALLAVASSPSLRAGIAKKLDAIFPPKETHLSYVYLDRINRMLERMRVTPNDSAYLGEAFDTYVNNALLLTSQQSNLDTLKEVEPFYENLREHWEKRNTALDELFGAIEALCDAHASLKHTQSIEDTLRSAQCTAKKLGYDQEMSDTVLQDEHASGQVALEQARHTLRTKIDDLRLFSA